MKTCVVVINEYKAEAKVLAEKIKEFLEAKKITVHFYHFNKSILDAHATEHFSNVDFVVTLGGDGTVLFAARNCLAFDVPVFPINLGEFGFIASIEKNEWQNELEQFLNGKSYIDKRNMITAARINENGNEFAALALNDIVISCALPASAMSFEVSYNFVSLGTYKADGIIVSTATGSTAYQASAGGPIVDPDLDAIVLTPMNAFSLSSRPLVLNPKGEIGITVLNERGKNAVISIDGQEPISLNVGDVVKIRKTQKKIKLVGCTPEKFYKALRTKLNWAGGPHA